MSPTFGRLPNIFPTAVTLPHGTKIRDQPDFRGRRYIPPDAEATAPECRKQFKQMTTTQFSYIQRTRYKNVVTMFLVFCTTTYTNCRVLLLLNDWAT